MAVVEKARVVGGSGFAVGGLPLLLSIHRDLEVVAGACGVDHLAKATGVTVTAVHP